MLKKIVYSLSINTGHLPHIHRICHRNKGTEIHNLNIDSKFADKVINYFMPGRFEIKDV